MRSRFLTRRPIQSSTAIVSRMSAAAIDTCSAAANAEEHEARGALERRGRQRGTTSIQEPDQVPAAWVLNELPCFHAGSASRGFSPADFAAGVTARRRDDRGRRHCVRQRKSPGTHTR